MCIHRSTENTDSGATAPPGIVRKLGKFWLCAVASVLVAAPAMAATFVVDSTADSVDAHPGDGVCADANGACTLRAAVMEANALAGPDTIDLTGISDPNMPIVLTITGADETYQQATGGGTGYVAVATHDASIGDLNITDSLSIVGAGSAKTIIEWSPTAQAQGSADRIFHIEAVTANVTVSISGVTVRNGYTPPVVDIQTTGDGKTWQFKRHGGGIAIGTSAATNLLDPTITHGSGGGGGGGHGGGESGGETAVAIDAVTLTDVNVVNCISGGDGGGIYNAAPLTLTDSVVSGNTAASNGGGIYASAGMTISKSTIGTVGAFSTPNHAENGGGIFDTGLHTTTIKQSAIVGNTATGGGALSGRSTTIDVIENSTIANNVAQDTAGGITTNGRVTLKNVTVSGNQVSPTTSSESTAAGAGLSSFGSGNISYVNTIISNNKVTGSTPVLSNCGTTGSGASTNFLTSSGHNLEDGDSCNLTAAGDLKNTDPQLQPLANNGGPTDTFAITQASPAVDAGDNSQCPNNDQRDGIRPADGKLSGAFVCDIGAFELFVHTADIHIDDMTAPDQAYATDPITVTVVVHNDPGATTSATGVTVTTDPLPASFTVTSAEVATASTTTACAVAGGVVTCDVGTLAPGDTATATIVGTAGAPGAIAITANVASTAPIDPNLANNTATVHVQVTGNADMAVTATGSATPVLALSNTDLSFTVTNNGPDTANDARVAAFLPMDITYQSASISQGTCVYSTTDGSVSCAIGQLASGASVTGTVTVSSAVGGAPTVLFGVDATERDQQPDNDTSTVALQITPWSDLQLAMSTSTANPMTGTTAPVTVTVSNAGGLATTNVKSVITLPTGVTFASSDPGSNCTASGGTVTCVSATLAAGAQVTSLFYVKLATAGTMTVTGVVSSDLTDTVAANNTATLAFKVSSPSSGGCTYRPGGAWDPTLATALVLGILALGARRLRAARAGRG